MTRPCIISTTRKRCANFTKRIRDLNLFDTEHGQELLPLSERASDGQTGQSPPRQTGRAARIGHDRKRSSPNSRAKGLKVEHYAQRSADLRVDRRRRRKSDVSHPLFSIPEILQKILEIGRRGVQIKRFKGLGEMNAKELFETTMNPEKRKLLRSI